MGSTGNTTSKLTGRLVKTLALVALATALSLVIGIRAASRLVVFQPMETMRQQTMSRQQRYPTVTPVPTSQGVVDLYSLAGELIARWTSPEPVTRAGVTGYRIEELSLPQPIQVSVNDKIVEVDTAWRITITGGPFPVLSDRYYIWIDDTAVPASPAGEGLVGIISDPSLLRQGAKIGFSYTDSHWLRQELPVELDFTEVP